MQYICEYSSPLGEITLAADEDGLTGLWFENQKYHAATLPQRHEKQSTPILEEARKWLDHYFRGKNPGFTPPLHPAGTPFRLSMWELLLQIPYGQTVTYGELAREMARLQNAERISAQAVGGAVGHNPISIIVPCHRVVGHDGSLTGYAGGIRRKMELLTLERAEMSGLFVPRKGTAL